MPFIKIPEMAIKLTYKICPFLEMSNGCNFDTANLGQVGSNQDFHFRIGKCRTQAYNFAPRHLMSLAHEKVGINIVWYV